MTIFSVTASCLLSYGSAVSLLLCLYRHLKWPLFSSLPPCTTPSLCSISPIICICSLFLASFLFPSVSILLSYFFVWGSQWREDGGPGFGHWCGRARWLCQYPWPAGNSAGSTTIQSGAPSWEEVPDNIWECLCVCVRERMRCKWKDAKDIISKKKHEMISASR